jgi:Cu(I)/Ag(I) efflux system membrane fusion protein
VDVASAEPLYWYDPMHPERHFDAPGKSPFMDMQLIPKYADAAGATVVRVAPGMAQNLGIRSAAVQRGSLARHIEATGRIEIDERTRHEVTVRSSGWVEALHVRAAGDPVTQGQLLAEIYSPALETAQREFLLARQTGGAALIDAAREQMRALGISEAQIAELERTRQANRRVNVYSPVTGYVMALNIRDGAAVTPSTTLFEVASHDPVWVIAAVPEAQADWVAPNDEAQVRVAAHPGHVFSGRVDYLYPELDMATRTRRVRVVLGNADDMLHPGMYAQVVLSGGVQRDVLLIPTEAVIRTGKRNVVIVADGADGFRPVSVSLGAEGDATIAILDGLSANDRVVVSGQFLIDSEASLQGAYRRMNARNEDADGAPR